MTCPHCEDLQDELDMLRREIRSDLEVAMVVRLSTRLRLSLTQAKLVLALHQANGRALTRAALEEIVSRRGGYESNTLSVMVSHIRDQIGHEAIGTIHGLGYRLSEAGKALVADAMAEPEQVPA